MKNKRFFEFLKFCVSGAIGASTSYAIFYVLIEYVGLWYLFSSMIAFIFSCIPGFILKKFWVFKNKNIEVVRRQIILYLIVYFTFFLINAGAMHILVEHYDMYDKYAQIIMIITLSILSYIVSGAIIFPPQKTQSY